MGAERHFRIYKSSLQIMILHNCSFQRTNGFVALLNAIFGQASDDSYLTSLEQLLSKHRHGRSEACLALRCTRGPVSGAIGWHFDGYYVTETIQVALSNDSE